MATTPGATDTVQTKRKTKVGRVVSDKMDKTIVVSVERLARHPLYKRVIRLTTKFKAHDEDNDAHVGDTVLIEESRPLSATKRWRLVSVVGARRRARPRQPERHRRRGGRGHRGDPRRRPPGRQRTSRTPRGRGGRCATPTRTRPRPSADAADDVAAPTPADRCGASDDEGGKA